MALNTIAQSSTDRHIGPTVSIAQLSAMAPWRLTRPYVGRNPEARVPPHAHCQSPSGS